MNKINYYHNKGFTIERIAEKLKVSRQTVINYGKKNNIKIEKDLKRHEILKPIVKKLYNRNYKDSDIAKILNISRRYVNDIKNKYNLKYYQPKPLSKQQKSIIIGTLLGDAHIQTRGNSRLSLHHSTKQLEYCKWKAEQLSSLKFHSYFSKQGKHTSVKFDSSVDVRLNEFSYEDKQLTDKWLVYYNSLSLAIHYMDDGNKAHVNGYNLNTQSFNNKSIEVFNEMCKRKFNISWNKHKDNRLYLPTKYAKRFAKIILPFMHETLLYKIHDKHKASVQVKSC